MRAVVRSGNSGGPMIAPDGQVIGVVFGAALDDQETGFVLTVDQVAAAVARRAPRLTREVDTGRLRRLTGAARARRTGSDVAGDRLVAAGADADRAHRGAGQLLDPLHVGPGVGRAARRSSRHAERSSNQPGSSSYTGTAWCTSVWVIGISSTRRPSTS